MTFKLRPYQELAHEMIVDGFKQGLKLLLLMSTGAGKSKTFTSFIDKYKKYYIFIVIVRRRGLVDQLENDFKFFNLDYGVFMSGHEKYDPKNEIQLCSIDTLHIRGLLPHLFAKKDIVLIIDEADESNADQYQEIIKRYTNRHNLTKPSHFNGEMMLEKIRPAFLLGVTATAFDYALPHFDKVIQPIKPKELRASGNLVDFVYYIPAIKDFSDVRIEKGEFNTKDMDRIFNSPKEIAAAFESWLRFGQDRQTLIFCTNKDHAKNFTNYINNYYGKRLAQQVDADTSDDDRLKYYTEFKNGQLRFLVNIRLITRGVDIPEIGCILDDAPTLSKNLHIQKLGRGSRPNPFYSDCIIIDYANNCVNNGHFYKEREVKLIDDKKTKRILGEEMRVCGNCFRAADPDEFGIKNTCPFCGHYNGKVKEKKISKAKQKEAVLQNASPEQIEQIEMINFFKKTLWKLQNLGSRYPEDIARSKAKAMLISKYGIEKAEKIKGSIGLKQDEIKRHKEKYNYVPLGGLM